MDNLNNPKKITIKINGQVKTFKDGTLVESKPEAAAAAEPEESFNWILPEEDEESERNVPEMKKPKPGLFSFGNGWITPNKKKPIVFLQTYLIPIICAVIIGTSLGFIVLKTIAGTATSGTQTYEGENVPTEKPVETADTGKEKKAAAVVTEIKTFLVQGGIFTTKDAAAEIQQKVAEKNVPAEIFKQEDQFVLYLGASSTLEETKKLAVFLKTYDVDVFWKEVTIKSGAKAKEQKILGDMVPVYQQLTKDSSAQLLGSESKLNQEKIDKQLAVLKTEVKKVSSATLSDAYNQLTAAAELHRQYQSSQEKTQLLQTQDKLLMFLQNYQK